MSANIFKFKKCGKMEKYFLTLLVTLEQETAIRDLFSNHKWELIFSDAEKCWQRLQGWEENSQSYPAAPVGVTSPGELASVAENEEKVYHTLEQAYLGSGTSPEQTNVAEDDCNSGEISAVKTMTPLQIDTCLSTLEHNTENYDKKTPNYNMDTDTDVNDDMSDQSFKRAASKIRFFNWLIEKLSPILLYELKTKWASCVDFGVGMAATAPELPQTSQPTKLPPLPRPSLLLHFLALQGSRGPAQGRIFWRRMSLEGPAGISLTGSCLVVIPLIRTYLEKKSTVHSTPKFRKTIYKGVNTIGLCVALSGASAVFIFTHVMAADEGKLQFRMPDEIWGGQFAYDQYFKNVGVFYQHEAEQLEAFVGRKMADSAEIKDKAITSHVARMKGHKEFNKPGKFQIVRQSQPFGNVSGVGGLFFIAYAASPENLNFMLDGMFRLSDGGGNTHDAIMEISTNTKGTYWYVPSQAELKAV
ncbi:YFEX-like protein [Mya arenaria]|uniref:YFEX-like protein n=1 Tax=Mya arenaria TaxID=6604 RepID=A0ABY7FGI4_MYAAR|nr:YFEX-like protein [Mya arenaria]